MKILLTVISFGLLVSCSNNSNATKDEKIITDSNTSTEIINDFSANYFGNIDGKYEINMELIKFQNMLGGTYLYTNKNIPIKISGLVDSLGKVTLTEYTKDSDISGYFEGQLKGNEINGTWFNADKSKSMPFKLKQSNIASLHTKSDVMSDAIGQFYLTSISGNTGANTMFDTYNENGKWESSSSSNIGGVREGATVNLTANDIALLDNLHIKVDDDLTLHLYAGLSELLKCPFNANGMDYRITEKDTTKLNDRIKPLSATTVIQDYKYVLIAADNIDFSKTIKGSFDVVAQDNLILSYDPLTKTFILDIFAGQCCDQNTFTFKSK